MLEERTAYIFIHKVYADFLFHCLTVKMRQKLPPVCRIFFTRLNGTTITEDSTFYSHCHEDLSSHNILPGYTIRIPEYSNLQESSYLCWLLDMEGSFVYHAPCYHLISPACRTEKPDFFVTENFKDVTIFFCPDKPHTESRLEEFWWWFLLVLLEFRTLYFI